MKSINPKDRLGGVSLIDEITNELINRGEVKVVRLGIFRVVKCKGLGKRTLGGKVRTVKDYNKIKFLPTVSLKRDIKTTL